MNGRKQKTEQDTWHSGNRSETESSDGGQTYLWMTEKENTNTTQGQQAQLLEYILSPSNLNSAYKQVKSNNGKGGVDGMSIESLLPYLQSHREELLHLLQNGMYKPQAVRRVEIPKENGKKRALGIPTVVDRVIQQAITQQLTPI